MPFLNFPQRFVFLTILLLVVGCSKPSVSTKTVVDGGSATGGKLWVTGFHAVMESSKPTTMFCQYAVAEGPRHSDCFLIIKEPPATPGRSEHKWEGNVKMTSEKARITGALNAGTSKFPIEFNVALQEDKTTLTETFIIGETTYSLDKGRVFLIELTPNSIRVVQHDFAIPSASAAETNNLEKYANQTLQALKNESPSIAVFLGSPAKK